MQFYKTNKFALESSDKVLRNKKSKLQMYETF